MASHTSKDQRLHIGPAWSTMLALLISCISLSLSLETTVSGNGHAQDVPLFPLQHQNNHEDVALKKDGSGAVAYEALFSTLGRSLLGPRQDSSDTSELLKNNQRAAVTISPGEIQLFKFPSEEFLKSKWAGEPSLPPSQAAIERDEHVELKRRQSDAREIFLSLSVCGQPTPSSEKTQMPPPALELYVSSPGACSPGPDSKDTAQTKLSVVEGLAKYNEDRSDDLCVAVRAPAASGFTGSYDFEIAASVDTYYSNYYDHQSLYLLDSDAKAGLFVSTNLTNPVTTDQDAIGKWHATDSPFSIFLYSKNDSSISGLTNSFCALNRTAQIKGIGGSSSDQTVDMSMTTIGDYRKAGTAKQLFYVPDLNASSSYYAIIGLSSNYSRSASNPPTAGGTVWKAIEFDTKSYENCQLIYGLPFCSSVAYAVPSNGSTNATELGRTYDNYAKSYWQNFTYSLQQIPCDTESEARYSLATDCATCSEAYKQWLCGVTIPRCADYNSELEWLQPRNVGKQLPNGDIPPTQINSIEHQNSISTNSSRNSMIDDIIKPGPYKEIMPCGSLCYGLVQACPASLGFGCPGKDIRGGFNDTYRDHGGNSTSPHCNFPGAVWGVSGGTHLTPPSALALGAYAMITIWLYLSLGV